MALKRRRLQLFRLTISGLADNTNYAEFLRSVRNSYENVDACTFKIGSKQHCLHSATEKGGYLRLLFYSFAPGDRPDVIEVNAHKIKPSPLKSDEANVTWTHIVGKPHSGRFRLCLEMSQGGVYPSTFDEYLQELIDRAAKRKCVTSVARSTKEPVTVNVEALAGEKFTKRLDALDRIKSVSIRIVKPNPGWTDLKSELSSEAKISNAGSAEVKLTAARGRTLNKKAGIVQEVRTQAVNGDLGYARIEGASGGNNESFSTDNLAITGYASVEASSNGQLEHDPAFLKFIEFLDSN